MIAGEMNTARMTEFLAQVSAAHRREFIIMVVDGASSHVVKDLVVPKNMRLLRLPPYAPELNPQEHVWDELREKEFPNRVYADMASVRAQLEAGLPRLADDHKALRSLTAWPWINRLILNAHCNKSDQVDLLVAIALGDLMHDRRRSCAFLEGFHLHHDVLLGQPGQHHHRRLGLAVGAVAVGAGGRIRAGHRVGRQHGRGSQGTGQSQPDSR